MSLRKSAINPGTIMCKLLAVDERICELGFEPLCDDDNDDQTVEPVY